MMNKMWLKLYQAHVWFRVNSELVGGRFVPVYYKSLSVLSKVWTKVKSNDKKQDQQIKNISKVIIIDKLTKKIGPPDQKLD